MVAVVTGSSGFIGSALCARLVADGVEVVGIDRRPGRFTTSVVDLRALRAADLPHGATVFHLAARPGVRHADVAEIFADNVAATRALAEALDAARPAGIVFASSSSVYGASPLPFREDQPLAAPRSPYARSKLIGEHTLRGFGARRGAPVTCARLFNVYGPGARSDLASAIFIRALRAGDPVTLAAGGAVERDLVYVDDVCTALIRLSRPRPHPTTVNVGSGTRVSMRALVHHLEALLGPATIIDGPPDPRDLPATQADLTHLRALLGWVPATPLEAGLAAMVGACAGGS